MQAGDFIAQSFQHLAMVFLFHAPKILFFYILFVIWFSNQYQWQKGNFLRHLYTLFVATFISAAFDFALFSPDPNGHKNIWMTIYDIAMTAGFAYLSFFSSPTRKPSKRPRPIVQLSDLVSPAKSPAKKAELTEEERIFKFQEKLATEARYSSQMPLVNSSGLTLQEVIDKKLFKVIQKNGDFLVYFSNGSVGLQDGLDLKVFPNEAACFNALDSLHRLKYLPYGASTSMPLSELFQMS
jgi:hypothetical protein